jgi:hypothetical protein
MNAFINFKNDFFSEEQATGNVYLFEKEAALRKLDNLEVLVKQIETELLYKENDFSDYHDDMLKYFYKSIEEINEMYSQLDYVDIDNAQNILNKINSKIENLLETINKFEEYQYQSYIEDNGQNVIDFNLIRFRHFGNSH